VSNSVIQTQAVTGPTVDLDAEDLVAAGPSGEDIFRERIQVTGAALVEVARVLNTAPLTTDYALNVVLSPNGPLPQFNPTLATYAASTNGFVLSSTNANTVDSDAYLFHPSANTKRVKIFKIFLSWSGNAGNNAVSFRGAFITAENGAPGGTVQTINPLDRADAASTLTFRTGATGAPVRVAGDLFSVAIIGGNTSQSNATLFDASVFGKPIVLRAGVSEGFEVRDVIGSSNIASALNIGIHYIWTEE
jgi:hypothetical protein